MYYAWVGGFTTSKGRRCQHERVLCVWWPELAEARTGMDDTYSIPLVCTYSIPLVCLSSPAFNVCPRARWKTSCLGALFRTRLHYCVDRCCSVCRMLGVHLDHSSIVGIVPVLRKGIQACRGAGGFVPAILDLLQDLLLICLVFRLCVFINTPYLMSHHYFVIISYPRVCWLYSFRSFPPGASGSMQTF